MKSLDADFRYMALTDLTSHLSHESFAYQSLDSSIETAIAKQVVELLTDKNTEVKNLAATT